MSRRWGRSIPSRILLSYLGLIVVLVASTGVAAGRWAAERARGPILERGRGIVETLRRSSFPLTEGVLEQLKGLGGAEFVLVDGTGRVRASTLGTAAPGGRFEEPPGARGEPFARAWNAGGLAYRVAVVDRPGRGTPVGRLVVLLPEPELEAAAREAWRVVGLFTVLGAGLAAAVAVGLGRTISRPLSAIVGATRRIGEGHLEATGLPVEREDEVGDLARAIAQMTGWLRRLQDEQIQTERLRLIRQVSAGLAHELRNPMTAARLTLQLYCERNSDRDLEPLHIAIGELERMERQIRRFLQMARPEPPSFQRVAVQPLVERVMASLEGTAQRWGLELTGGCEEGVRDLRADPEQLGQVLSNLLGNGLEAAGPGGRVRLRAANAADGGVAFVVEDDGPGVAPEQQARLFQPFFTTKPEGVGLGLALCQAMVREHGGELVHERAEGWTRFRVRVPGWNGGTEGGPQGGPAAMGAASSGVEGSWRT